MLIPTATIGLATPVGNGLTGNSAVINTAGLFKGVAGLKSDHAGTLSVQRYADAAGVVPVGAPLSVAVAANTPIAVGWSEGLPCGSIVMTFVNSGGAAANLTNVTVNLGP
jgi:hypothetical protein